MAGWWRISIWKAIMQPDPVLLYHITHLDNLPGILRTGCLHCHRQLHQAGQHPVNIAYQGIQDRRARHVCVVRARRGAA